MQSINKQLEKSVKVLFTMGLIGQFAFAIYIFIYYGGSALEGNWQKWTDRMINGFLKGDFWGNTALMIHILLAFSITIGGPLQFVKRFREKGKIFHKWNGRIYIVTAIIISLVALYLVWARETSAGGLVGAIGTSTNGILIICFAIMTWRTAMNKNFIEHRKWAIRTYIAVCGVWFIRIGYGVWILVSGFTVPGMKSDLTGWYDRFLFFGSYLIPLFIVEVYFRVKESENVKWQKALTISFYILTVLLIGGSAITSKLFWIDSIFPK